MIHHRLEVGKSRPGKDRVIARMQMLSGRWLGRQDSNLGMAVPKTAALPLGDAPTAAVFSEGRGGVQDGKSHFLRPAVLRLCNGRRTGQGVRNGRLSGGMTECLARRL